MAMSVYTLAPLAGPALGPIAGGFIAENASWRWVRRLTYIYDALMRSEDLLRHFTLQAWPTE